MDDVERAMVEEFDRQYRLGVAPARRRVEEAVLGSGYGATSYTTLRQAAELAERLELGPGVSLLDLGAGSGWPGLHLAAVTGCRVVLADRPGRAFALRSSERSRMGRRISANSCDPLVTRCPSAAESSTPSPTPMSSVDWSRSSPC
ncbi:MAG: hypothetical protein U9N84_07265 [Actinomycetota bacterium]|nr:hypothetical protein [Actinomycetota bacterium]